MKPPEMSQMLWESIKSNPRRRDEILEAIKRGDYNPATGKWAEGKEPVKRRPGRPKKEPALPMVGVDGLIDSRRTWIMSLDQESVCLN